MMMMMMMMMKMKMKMMMMMNRRMVSDDDDAIVDHDDRYEWLHFRYNMFPSPSHYFQNKLSQEDAANKCKLAGAILAPMRSEGEQTYVDSLMPDNTGYWIGLDDVSMEGMIEWMNEWMND